MGWEDDAMCRGMDPNLFHPEAGDRRTSMRARAVCERCPVRDDCLADALKSEHGPRSVRFGIRGGLTAEQRYRLQHELRRTASEEDRAEREWAWARLRRVLAEVA